MAALAARSTHTVRAALCRLLVASCLLCSALTPALAQAPALVRAEEELPGRPAGPDVGIDPALLQQLEDQTAAVRGITPTHQVPLRVISRNEFAAFVERVSAATTTDQTEAEERARSSNGWKLLLLLGLVTPTANPVQISQQVVTQQIAGLYFPSLKAMLIITPGQVNGLAPRDQIAFVHEFTHALQDQRFDLTVVQGERGNGDTADARRALVEGDAQLSAALWTRDHLTPDDLRAPAQPAAPTDEDSEDDDAGDDRPQPSLPRFIQEELQFTYVSGMRFVADAYQRGGGYAGVDAVYADPPASSEQILHPEKYWAHEAPIEVTIPEVEVSLGNGWQSLASDVLGEKDLLEVLEEYSNQNAAAIAAAGWGGGRWTLVEHDGHPAAILKTTWDTERDAREFYDVYAHGLRTRFPDATQEEATARRQALTDAASATATELRIRGRDVLAVISFDRASAEALAAATGF